MSPAALLVTLAVHCVAGNHSACFVLDQRSQLFRQVLPHVAERPQHKRRKLIKQGAKPNSDGKGIARGSCGQ